MTNNSNRRTSSRTSSRTSRQEDEPQEDESQDESQDESDQDAEQGDDAESSELTDLGLRIRGRRIVIDVPRDGSEATTLHAIATMLDAISGS
jgi:hypothetical protein